MSDAYAEVAAYELQHPDAEWLVLLLHGLGGDRHQAMGLIGEFDDSRLAVLAPDLRAHGDTRMVGEAGAFTLDALARDVSVLIERLGQGKKPLVVAGVSLGAAVAIRLAIGGRLDLRALILVRPAFDDVPCPPNLDVMPVLADLLELDDADLARAALLDAPEYRRIADVTVSGAKSVEEQLTKPMARERAIRLREVPNNVAWLDDAELKALDMPTLVVGTARDAMHPIEIARRIARLVPEAQLVEVTPRDVDPKRYNLELRTVVTTAIMEALDAPR